MQFLHWEFDASPQNVILVNLDKQANVRLLDAYNFGRYRRGETHRYFGGHAKASPVRLTPPHYGHWYVVVDLGGYGGSVQASARMLR